MNDERQQEEQVEDLDVAREDADAVKGGIGDGTSNTIQFGEAVAKPKGPTPLQQACASGKHFPDAQITV
jgi:hypothetical protein